MRHSKNRSIQPLLITEVSQLPEPLLRDAIHAWHFFALLLCQARKRNDRGMGQKNPAPVQEQRRPRRIIRVLVSRCLSFDGKKMDRQKDGKPQFFDIFACHVFALLLC